MSTVDDRFTDAPLLHKAAAFLKTVLFSPHFTAGTFDADTFDREKTNLELVLASLDDDRTTQAALGVQRLYFGVDPELAIPSFGTREDLAPNSTASLTAVYHTMNCEDTVVNSVRCDVLAEKVAALFADWPLAARSTTTPAIAFNLPEHAEVDCTTAQVVATTE